MSFTSEVKKQTSCVWSAVGKKIIICKIVHVVEKVLISLFLHLMTPYCMKRLPDIITWALWRRISVDSELDRHSYFPASLSRGSLKTRSKSPCISYLGRHCGFTSPFSVVRVSVKALPTHSSWLLSGSMNLTEQFRRRVLLLPSVWWVFSGFWMKVPKM